MDPQAGGKLLSEGGYGCIYVPNLKCKGDVQTLPQNDQVKHDTKIDKIMSIRHANIEFAISKRIQQVPLWKKYYIVPDVLCEPEPKDRQVNANIDDCSIIDKADWKDLRILRMSYGGKTLRDYRIQIQNFHFMQVALHLLEAVALLTLNGIVHMDLHDGNILIDGSSLHLIDFNLAIHVSSEGDLVKRLYHNYQPTLVQQPPDYLLVNAQARISANDTEVPPLTQIIDEQVDTKAILRKERSALGLQKSDQRRPLQDFLTKSQVLKTGDLPGWFKIYWRTIDSWAVGTLLTELMIRLSLWPGYTLPPTFTSPTGKGRHVLRKLCEPNPLDRYDAVQALAELDPENTIVKQYGQAWLKAIKP